MEHAVQGLALRVVLEFFKTTLPFKMLDHSKLDELAKGCVIEYYPKGTIIFEQNVTEVSCLCLIQKGAVRVYWTDSDRDQTLRELCSEGAVFGALSIVRGQKASANVEAIEDTFCFLLKKEVFITLVESDSRFAQFYLQTFSEDFIGQAYGELRSNRLRLKEQGALRLFNSQVESIVKKPPVTVPPGKTIREAGARMAHLGIGSLLVEDPSGRIAGIVTDQDLRSKVVAQGMDYGTPIINIMTTPVYTIAAKELCFEALLTFVKQGVDHLVVEHQGQIIGVITARDIMVYQGTWPIHLFREIPAQRTMEGLYDLSLKIPMALRTLIEEGARAESVTRVITLINDNILTRLLELLQEDIGTPPLGFCWLTLGSEGRREQALSTGQNNAIIYQDESDPYKKHSAEIYFEFLASQATLHLESCGNPRSMKDTMASNPRWQKPYTIWQDYFDHWISTPDPQEASPSTPFFDFRPSYGEIELGEALRGSLMDRVQRQHMFLAHLAADCIMNVPPLSFFRDTVVERNGQRRRHLDLKTRCLDPFADFGRLMALRYGIAETNTFARMHELSRQGRISLDLFADAREAYEFAIQLNLVHQLKLKESGLAPDSYLDPSELSEVERAALKDTFSVINNLLAHIRLEFPFLF